MVLSSFMTSTILSIWREKVDVVATDVMLGQVDNRLGQTDFAVVVSGVLGDITRQLGNLKGA